MHNAMVDNIVEMFKATDNADEMKQKLLAVLANPKFDPMKPLVVGMLRHGWERELEGSQSFVTNIGVTAALIMSVTLGYVFQPANQPVPDGDSIWDDERDIMADITFVCFEIASALALGCVVMSLMWVTASTNHVHDADDFL